MTTPITVSKTSNSPSFSENVPLVVIKSVFCCCCCYCFFFNHGLLAAGSRLRCQLPAAVGERSPRSSGGETLLHLLRVKFIFPVVCSIVFFRQSCYVKPSVPGAFLSWKITKNYLLPVVYFYMSIASSVNNFLIT